MLGYNVERRNAAIWTEGGPDFIIYPNDHSPAHVHVLKAGDEVIINLGDAHTLAYVRSIYRMRTKDVRRALGVVIREQGYFLEIWGNIHGGN
jgi:hypothetical protein